jgi:hypothetical protein
MKLNAAVLFQSIRPMWATSILTLLLGLSFLLIAGTASALDVIDISAQAAAANDAEATDATKSADDAACPRLIQIKYPFLHCAKGEIGMSDGDDDWENSRQIPMQTEFVEGNGYFGPDLNQPKD